MKYDSAHSRKANCNQLVSVNFDILSVVRPMSLERMILEPLNLIKPLAVYKMNPRLYILRDTLQVVKAVNPEKNET